MLLKCGYLSALVVLFPLFYPYSNHYHMDKREGVPCLLLIRYLPPTSPLPCLTWSQLWISLKKQETVTHMLVSTLFPWWFHMNSQSPSDLPHPSIWQDKVCDQEGTQWPQNGKQSRKEKIPKLESWKKERRQDLRQNDEKVTSGLLMWGHFNPSKIEILFFLDFFCLLEKKPVSPSASPGECLFFHSVHL